MRDIVTEDIIRNALNESIDEFILEEGAWDGLKNWWNKPYMQTARNYASKAGNWLKNAAAMYMDAKTGGQWNRKYNIHSTAGNGSVNGFYYLEKWLTSHYNRLYDTVYGDYYYGGNRQYFYTQLNGREQSFNHNWRNNSYTLTDNYSGFIYRLQVNYNNIPSVLTIENYNGVEIAKSTNVTYSNKDNSYEFVFGGNNGNLKIFTGEDDTTPEVYIAKNCTPNSFVRDTRNTLGDGDFKNAVITYLQKIQSINSQNIEKLKRNPNEKINYNYMLELFTTSRFYKWYNQNKAKIAQQSNKQQTQNRQQNTSVQNASVQQTSQQQSPAVKNGSNLPSNPKIPIFNFNNN